MEKFLVTDMAFYDWDGDGKKDFMNDWVEYKELFKLWQYDIIKVSTTNNSQQKHRNGL